MIKDESDYYPYGGERTITDSDSNRYKFTGKERDTESGLDEFGARYYGSSLGRFMTPDWAAKPTDVPYANFGNPQSLNLYSYVQNNPTTVGDPDGHCPLCIVVEEFMESPAGEAVENWGAQAAAGAGVLLTTAAAALSDGSHGMDGPSHIGDAWQKSQQARSAQPAQPSTQNAPPAQSSQSTPAQPPEDGEDTTRGARREAMRQEGIPTSQQPKNQVSTEAGRQYTYEVPKSGGGTQTKIVTNQLKDSNHGPHIEAGAPKANGQVDPSGRLRHANPKIKVKVK